MSWLKDTFGTHKPIIAMLHLPALPSDPGYDHSRGMALVVEHARADLAALQAGGVDAVMISNESSLPYLTKARPVTAASMARVIGELRNDFKVPFGVNVLWDPIASLDLAAATDAVFVREVFTGVYASDFGLWNPDSGEALRHRDAVGANKVRLLFNILPESASYLGERKLEDIARSTVFNNRPDALCVSGLTAGAETSAQALQIVKSVVPETPLFANTGVRLSNLEEQLSIADGAVVGSTFKQDGYIWNAVDSARVKEFMQKAKAVRGK
jgi:membrane complex biogenesis BtpA family protein